MFIQIGIDVVNLDQVTRFQLHPDKVLIWLTELDDSASEAVIVTGDDAELLREWIDNKLDLYVIKGGA